MKKSVLIIIGIVLAVGIIAVGYFLRSNSAAPSTATEEASGALPAAPTQPANNGGTPSLAGSDGQLGFSIRSITSIPVLDYAVDRNNVAYFVEENGKVARSSHGTVEVLSDAVLSNISFVRFSEDGKKVAVILKNTTGFTTSIFDLDMKTWKAVPINAPNIVWSPLGNEVAHFVSQAGRNTLSILNIQTAKAKPRPVLDIRGYDFTLQWPEDNRILIGEKPSASVMADIFAFDINTSTLTPIVQDRRGAELIWDGAAHQGVLFQALSSGHGGQLSLIRSNGSLVHNLTFLTLPRKCAFSAQAVPAPTATTTPKSAGGTSGQVSTSPSILECAIPRDTQQFSQKTLPDDYLKGGLFTIDDFYRINLDDGTIVKMADNADSLDAYNVKSVGGTMFFQNRFDNRVYGIENATR